MASSVVEKLEKHLECGICLERFCLEGPEEPKMLPCQHTYCKKCLDRLVTRAGPEDYKVTCPECREKTEVPGGDVTRLQPSYLIKKFLSIDEERVICNKHKGKDIDLFCESCDQVICCVCAVIDHREHQCTHLKEVFLAQKENIMTFVTKASANIPVLKAAIESMQEREKNVQENSKAVRREVDAFIDEHIESMERKRESLKQDLESLTSNQIKQLHDHKEFLSSILGRVEAGVQAAEQVLASENEAKVLSKKNEIIQQMNTLSLFEAPPDTRETIFCELEAKSLLENGTVEKMATISQNGEFVLSMLGGEPGVIYTTRAEQTCHFVLTPRKKNEAAPRESDEILVNIKMPKVKSVSPDIENNEDGTYSFSYRPDDTGSYYIEILINDMNSCGSPVTWQVEPALYLPGSVLRNWPRTRRASERDDVCVFQEGQHSWKTQLILRQDGQTATDEKHQLGVIHFGGRCKSYWEEGQRFSIANDDFYKRVKASVQSFQNDDVFVCYLNIDKGQLIIYNERTQQSDTFNNLKPPISPLYYPEQNKLFKVPRARGIPQVPPRGVPGQQQPGGAGGPNQRVGGMPLQDQQVRGPGPMQSRGQRPAYKFQQGVRNQPQAHPGAVPMQPKERVPQAIYIPGQEPLNPSVLAAATPQEQKQMLGERLFPLVQFTCPELAGKITGMLLEIDNAELLHMLESREALAAKIQETVSVIRAHNAKEKTTDMKN